uniref:39S ribosomal protein L27, mitochondrial n=1 Tax=Panagrellus redivivus TaxID=6233 RepID=A0A7E4VVT6_PANRE
MNLLKTSSIVAVAKRGLLRPSRNVPYFGLYRTQGETVRKDDLLVSQKYYNYHPGANVYHVSDRGIQMLKADVDGTVLITREKAEVDQTDPAMQAHYKHRNFENIYKLTYNVVPLPMSNRFKLIDEV